MKPTKHDRVEDSPILSRISRFPAKPIEAAPGSAVAKEIQSLSQHLSAIRERGLEAFRRGDYLVHGRLTAEAAQLNRSITKIKSDNGLS